MLQQAGILTAFIAWGSCLFIQSCYTTFTVYIIAQFHSDKVCLLTQGGHQRKMNEIEWFYELESFFHFRKKIEPKKSKKKSKSKPKDRHRLKVNL